MKYKCDVCGEVDYAILDGYSVGDRILDGVKFEIRFQGDKPVATAVTKDCVHYFEQLNQKKWFTAASACAEEWDVFECPLCGADMGNPKIGVEE